MKNAFSYFLLLCAAVVAYLYITHYVDTVMQENFTTQSVTQINKKSQEVVDSGVDVKIGVQALKE